MKRLHPCRKMILKEFDFEILKIIENNPASIDEIFNRLNLKNFGQLKSRLKKLKKHKIIKANKEFSRVQKGENWS